MDGMHVSDVMTAPMLTLEAGTTVADAARGMREAGINSVVVTGERCRPEGILTSTDVVAVAADGTPPDEATVEEHMTADVVTVSPGTALRAAAERMTDRDISHLPVTDDDGDGVGILTKTDLTAALSEAGVPTAP